MRKYLFLTGIIIVELFVLYVIGSFISWDFNLTTWWLLTTTLGRILFIILLILIIVGAYKGWTKYE